MKQSSKLYRWRGVGSLTVAVCAALLSLSNVQTVFAQQAVAVKPVAVAPVSPQTAVVSLAAKPAAKEEETTAAADKLGTQGIKVHGHWVMDIKNPDGTLVKHLDFENSLTAGGGTGSTDLSTGDQILAALLSGIGVNLYSPAIYFIGAQPALAALPAGSDITALCFTPYPGSLPGATCGIVTTTSGKLLSEFNTNNTETTLTATVNFSPTVSWVLSGNFTIPSGMTSLTAVQTWLPLCIGSNESLLHVYGPQSAVLAGSWSDTSSASSCVNTINNYVTYAPLTSTLVPNAPQTIVPGQIIQVTVTLSFS